jgi:hypothetical protein
MILTAKIFLTLFTLFIFTGYFIEYMTDRSENKNKFIVLGLLTIITALSFIAMVIELIWF